MGEAGGKQVGSRKGRRGTQVHRVGAGGEVLAGRFGPEGGRAAKMSLARGVARGLGKAKG